MNIGRRFRTIRVPAIIVSVALAAAIVCHQNSVRQQIQAINANAGTDPYATQLLTEGKDTALSKAPIDWYWRKRPE